MQMRHTCGRLATIGLLVSAGIGLTSLSSSPAAVEARHAGTVVAVDEAAGVLVIEEVGPMVKSGKSEIHPLRVRVSATTRFALVKRAEGAGPDGWIGAYVETPLPVWSVRKGDYAVLTTENAAAVTVTVVELREP